MTGLIIRTAIPIIRDIIIKMIMKRISKTRNDLFKNYDR